MKQLALAILNYHDSNNEFPRGTVRQPSLPPGERLSWIVELLPYLEQKPLYKRVDQSAGWAGESNQQPAATQVKTLMCPGQPIQTPVESWTFTSYVGIAGVGGDAASLPLENARCGVFGYERRIMLKDVKDGASNTLSIIETMSENGRWVAGGRSTVRGVDPALQPYIGENRPFGTKHRKPFLGSMEFASLQTLANAAMLDGSVRAISTSISAQTFEALATIAGHDEIGPDF